ncbi:hypothetical protein [Poseidonibacter lekithochrous]|uniref:hypothetical protein n=1 Tax=Poseidonibacter lekithochrous TaxID=1904463 RepID=UPI0008FCB0D2|nr:hypothetical protein [Poseidonibacter lekithochrous]QKJ22783.1 hypothetical protein ALEK_1512 [Poseidonibacter lekithochrous]
MATYALVAVVTVIAIWLYSMFSILSSKFKNKDERKVWLIGVLLIPIMSLFYLFAKKDLLK